MKDSWITEILALILAGMSGVLIGGYGWIGFIAGLLILFVDSYFIISKLKEQTIREYLSKSKEGKNK